MQNITKKHNFLNAIEKEGVRIFIDNIRNILKDNLVNTAIFGSKVIGNFNAESDIDILVILNRRTWAIQAEICGQATEINLQFGINISPLIITKIEYEKNEHYETVFAKEVGLTGVKI